MVITKLNFVAIIARKEERKTTLAQIVNLDCLLCVFVRRSRIKGRLRKRVGQKVHPHVNLWKSSPLRV